MIDIFRETTFPLSVAPDQLPALRRGRKPSVATLYRWTSIGLHGIQLECVQVGGCRCTSIEALQRFFNRLTHSSTVPPAPARSNDRLQMRHDPDLIDEMLDSQGL